MELQISPVKSLQLVPLFFSNRVNALEPFPLMQLVTVPRVG